MSSPLSEEELSSVLARRWAIDCLRMTLCQQGTNALKYSGPGSIRHGTEGNLEYVLYDTSAGAPEFLFFGGRPGEWLKAEDFFVLRAVDQWGREWTAEWVSADTSTRFDEPGAVVYGTIRELVCAFPLGASGSAALLHGPAPVAIPVNARTETSNSEAGRESKAFSLDVWRSTTSIGEILLKKSGDILKARLERSDSALPKDITIRLEESLSFMLGAQIKWAVEQTLSDGTFRILLRSGIEAQRKPRLRPPIETNSIDAIPDRAMLLDRVLDFLTSTAANDGEYHPLAQVVLRVLRASGTGIEDEALILSTAVESVTQYHFKTLLNPTASLVTAIDSALAHIESWLGPSDIRERIKGAVRRIKEANVSEALKKLESSGVLRSGHTEKWRELRNPAAHGARSPHDIQGFVARCDIVYDLLLRLVFQLVRFKGRYSNHTVKGWPLEPFAPV